MLKYKFNGVEKRLPTRWEELSFKEYVSVIGATRNNVQMLSIILGEPIERIAEAKFDGLDTVIFAMSFLCKPIEINPYPTSLGSLYHFDQVNLYYPEQIDRLNELVIENCQKELPEQAKGFALYAAVYLQALDQVFDFEKAVYLSEQIMIYPCTEVLSIGSAALMRAMAAQSGKSMEEMEAIFKIKKEPVSKFKTWLSRINFR